MKNTKLIWTAILVASVIICATAVQAQRKGNKNDLANIGYHELVEAGSVSLTDEVILIQGDDVPKKGTSIQDLMAVIPAYDETTVTLTLLNTGVPLIDGVEGKQIVVVDFNMEFNGTFTTLTTCMLEDESGTINAAQIPQASMADGTVVNPGSSNIVPGVGMVSGLTEGEGLYIRKTGSSAAGGTDLTVGVLYILK